jgi:ribosome-associated heat shock protein Hsp15
VSAPADSAPEEPRQRIDKWLWHARLVRTRTAARAFAVSGRVRVNREKNASPAHLLRAGDVLTISLSGRVRVLRVRAIAERRGAASDAALLYEDLIPAARSR